MPIRLLENKVEANRLIKADALMAPQTQGQAENYEEEFQRLQLMKKTPKTLVWTTLFALGVLNCRRMLMTKGLLS